METKTMLDNISTAIERVVKALQAEPRTKRMALDAFVGYALSELKKAATDEPKVAERRLSALKRSVDGALAALAKLNPEDVDSTKVEVEVLTAWAPSTAEGDEAEDLTTADEQSSTETSPVAIEPALGNTAFAQNLDEVAKVLRRMRDEIDGKKPGDKERGEAKKSAGDAWPLDLNNTDFRKGVQKAEAAPEWGFDPEGVATKG